MKKALNYILNPIYSLLALYSKNYELTIARKYIFQFKREVSFISLITFISFFGLMLGIAALIAVISIFNGFSDFATEQLTGFDPHLRVNIQSIADSTKFENYLNTNINNAEFSRVKYGKAILKKNNTLQAAYMYSIPTEQSNIAKRIRNKIAAGQFDITSSPLPGIVLGIGLSESLSALPGDTILLQSPDLIEESVKTMSYNHGVKAIVTGLFISNFKEYDETVAFSSMETGNNLFFKANENNLFYDIRLDDFTRCEKVKEQINAQFPKYEISTWYDLHNDMFNIMKLEKLLVVIILSVIVCIAIFNLLASLSMTVIEKQRDISIMKTMGISDKSIKKIFMLCGSYIGLLAVFWGTILGLGFCYGQQTFNWFALDTTKYLIKGLPISIDYYSVLIIDIFTVILSIVSTLIPVRYAETQKISEFLNNN